LAALFAREIMTHPRPIPRSWQVVPLGLALLSIALGLFSALPFEFLQIGRPDPAAEGL
jgi:multicomponent Na+:H+ antiporter subunit D